jgi:hypothetical protein
MAASIFTGWRNKGGQILELAAGYSGEGKVEIREDHVIVRAGGRWHCPAVEARRNTGGPTQAQPAVASTRSEVQEKPVSYSPDVLGVNRRIG